uniref:SAGA-associated factor 29 n=1 Tax=Phallusia mammillata TaxID=59560 RepID=A0A6F9D7V9_9ASCI|nr:SAGA-associated factor 29 homolog [Phallusia mammillata]
MYMTIAVLVTSVEFNKMASDYENKLKTLISELFDAILETELKRQSAVLNLEMISKTHEKVQSEQKISSYYKQKLNSLYNTALQDSDAECDMLRKCLELIAGIKSVQEEKRVTTRVSTASVVDEQPRKSMRRGVLMSMLQKSAQTLPLWIGKPHEKVPYLCGAISASVDYIAKPGDKVAAKVKTEEEEQWILAEVVSYNSTTLKYEVDDIDEEGRAFHTLSKRKVVPLPQWKANPETDPNALFEKGTLVMALYPQTTCFYRAVISERPTSSFDDYLVLFEDNSYADGYSPALRVAQKHKISSGVKGFRRIDVDQYDEEKFNEDQVDQNDSGPDNQEVNQLLLGGNNAQALRTCLASLPVRTKDIATKENATLLTIRVLSSIKAGDVASTIQSLNIEELDAIMKYIYKGFSMNLDGQQCACLLTWHEKVTAKGGMGCIIRVLADRKRL